MVVILVSGSVEYTKTIGKQWDRHRTGIGRTWDMAGLGWSVR